RRRHTRSTRDWSSDVCSSDLARIGAGGKFGLEFLDPASRIDVFQLAGKEWMASRADIDLQLLLRAARLEGVAATTRDGRLDVGRSEERRVGKEGSSGGW